MDPDRLKREFGDRLVFWGGGCDTQSVLGRATPEEIRQHVKERIATFGPNGGYVFNQVHNIQANVPPENILAMFDAAYEFGGYSAPSRLATAIAAFRAQPVPHPAHHRRFPVDGPRGGFPDAVTLVSRQLVVGGQWFYGYPRSAGRFLYSLPKDDFMPRLSSTWVAGVALAMMGGIIAPSTRPAVSGDNGQKTTANQKTTTATDPAAAKSAPSPFAAEALAASADEKAIRATADDFVKAFNAADAKAIGALWATDAEYTDESGAVVPRPRRDREGICRLVQGASRRDHDGRHRVDPLSRTGHRH